MIALLIVLVWLLIVACVLYGCWKAANQPLDMSDVEEHQTEDTQ